MDREKQIQKIGEIEEITHIMIGLGKTQEAIPGKLGQRARSVINLKHYAG
jgi:hypothetical protein